MEELAPGAALSFGRRGVARRSSQGTLSMPNVNLLRRRDARGARRARHRIGRSQPFEHTLVELGRGVGETERLAEIALQWADEDDVVSHAYARGALARCQAADGRARQALESAHNAVKLLSTGDFLNAHGDALFDRAIVSAVGDREGARAPLQKRSPSIARRGTSRRPSVWRCCSTDLISASLQS